MIKSPWRKASCPLPVIGFGPRNREASSAATIVFGYSNLGWSLSRPPSSRRLSPSSPERLDEEPSMHVFSFSFSLSLSLSLSFLLFLSHFISFSLCNPLPLWLCRDWSWKYPAKTRLKSKRPILALLAGYAQDKKRKKMHIIRPRRANRLWGVRPVGVLPFF